MQAVADAVRASVPVAALLAAGVLIWPPASLSGQQAPNPPADDVRFVRVDRVFGANPPAMFVEDEFIVVLTGDARARIQVGQDAAGRPTVNIPAFQTIINAHRVIRFGRQFPAALPQPAGSPFTDLTGHYKVRIAPGVDLDVALNAFSRDPNVQGVEKIGIHPVSACATGTPRTPNDTWYDDPPLTFNYPQWDLWDLSGIDADIAWPDQTGDASVVLVAMDTGVRYFHGDLGGTNPPGPSDNDTNGNVWVNAGEIPGNGIDDDGNGRIDDVIGWDFVSGNPTACDAGGGEDCDVQDNDPRDYNGHGTHTAGTMAAITNNDYVVAGIAGGFGDGSRTSPGNGCRIMCLRIGWQDLLGRGFVRMDYAAEAMNYVADMKLRGVNIAAVNCSWGSSNSGGFDAAVNNVLAADVKIIHSAGNSNSSTPDYLGSKDGVMNVAATDKSGNKASFSNYGSWVDLAAPGVDIVSTWHQYNDPGPDYVAVLSGTSMAAPHVAGLAALLESCNPGLSGPDKFALMVDATCPAGSANIGGILNARLALDAACPALSDCIDNSDCDDGDVCNGVETCDSGTCQPGVPLACDDGNVCNGAETCDPVLGCQAGDPLNCDDNDACTIDDCEPATGCVHEVMSCLQGEVCVDGRCEPQSCNRNSTCEAGEDCSTCEDCISGTGGCGDGFCEPALGENCETCSQDCNGKRNGNPSGRFCCGADVSCDDPRCTGDGFDCSSGVSVSYCCGDGICEGMEDGFNCEVDCGQPPPCLGPNMDCSSDSQCCSGNCRSNGKKAGTCS